jgi:microcystin-dependent protein
MGTPYLGEIRLMSFSFAPKSWAQCNGQLLSISQNQALFSILGTTYGGNGITTFGLPDLRGRVPLHVGNGFYLGQAGGSETVALTMGQSAHSHALKASSAVGTQASPALHYPAASAARNVAYASTADSSLNAASVSSTSNGGQVHSNMQPSLALEFCIALQGIFPSQN